MSKPKVGFYWCASCGGCEEAVVDLAEDVLKVVEAVDIAFWPVALDFKRSDVENMKDGELAVCFINGAIRTSEQEEMAELLRKKAQLLIAFGSCSHMGGIPGLANVFDREEIFAKAYREAPSVVNPEGVVPQEQTKVDGQTLHLPAFRDTVKTLDQTVEVDYYLPGCPPPVKLIVNAVTAILEGKLPPKGTVLAPDVALCDECPRKATKPDKLALKELKRPHEVIMDSEKCLLAQGLLCLGPATRSGCGAPCTGANMPCTGCLGPTSRVRDYGAKALSAIASLIDSKDEAEIAALMEQIVDPVGTFYRYSLPASLLHRRVRHSTNGGARE
jgi:F420-non-reducing hydrogenase small subunit